MQVMLLYVGDAVTQLALGNKHVISHGWSNELVLFNELMQFAANKEGH